MSCSLIGNPFFPPPFRVNGQLLMIRANHMVGVPAPIRAAHALKP